MLQLSDRASQIFTSGFVGFFLAPAVAILMLAFWAPDSVNYGNSGLVLLVSVLTGGIFGAIVGAVEYRTPLTSEFSDEMVWIDELWDKDIDA